MAVDLYFSLIRTVPSARAFNFEKRASMQIDDDDDDDDGSPALKFLVSFSCFATEHPIARNYQYSEFVDRKCLPCKRHLFNFCSVFTL